MNTIPGNPESVVRAIPEKMELKSPTFPTFYGSYYNTVNHQSSEVWTLY